MRAPLAAGSFDSRFRVAEDTELGARLVSQGYKVLYWPTATAEHDHLNFRTDDIVRRARSYGTATLLLLQKHPSLLGDGTGPSRPPRQRLENQRPSTFCGVPAARSKPPSRPQEARGL